MALLIVYYLFSEHLPPRIIWASHQLPSLYHSLKQEPLVSLPSLYFAHSQNERHVLPTRFKSYQLLLSKTRPICTSPLFAKWRSQLEHLRRKCGLRREWCWPRFHSCGFGRQLVTGSSNGGHGTSQGLSRSDSRSWDNLSNFVSWQPCFYLFRL